MREYRSMVAFVVPLLAAPALAAGPPSAKELLEKYGANLDKQTSFIVKFETSGFGAHNMKGSSAGATFNEGEACYDGCRTAHRVYTWGAIDDHVLAPSDRVYHSLMWDGTATYSYRRSAAAVEIRGEIDNGMLTRVRTRSLDEIAKRLRSGERVTDVKPVTTGNNGCFRPSEMAVSEEFGYLIDDMERLDVVLLEQSKSLSVRPKMVKVNGTDCYVIDAGTRRGKYTLWIDPKHGYQSARVMIARRGGDEALNIRGYKLPHEGSSIDVTVDYLRFQNVDGVWVAVETKHRYNRIIGTTHQFYRCRNHIRIASVQLNPDHEALRSFEPHDVLDGALVTYDSERWANEGAGEFVWRNGRLVPERGAWARRINRDKKRSAPGAVTQPSAVATRPSTRAARTDTRPAAGRGGSGETTATRWVGHRKRD